MIKNEICCRSRLRVPVDNRRRPRRIQTTAAMRLRSVHIIRFPNSILSIDQKMLKPKATKQLTFISSISIIMRLSIFTEAYRSGHNGPHSKCGSPQGLVSSNLTASATQTQTYIRLGFFYCLLIFLSNPKLRIIVFAKMKTLRNLMKYL